MTDFFNFFPNLLPRGKKYDQRYDSAQQRTNAKNLEIFLHVYEVLWHCLCDGERETERVKEIGRHSVQSEREREKERRRVTTRKHTLCYITDGDKNESVPRKDVCMEQREVETVMREVEGQGKKVVDQERRERE
jgi:hypothetical protein